HFPRPAQPEGCCPGRGNARQVCGGDDGQAQRTQGKGKGGGGKLMSSEKKAASKKTAGTLKIKWVRSSIACAGDMRQTIRGLGLRRTQTGEPHATPAGREILKKIRVRVKGVQWEKRNGKKRPLSGRKNTRREPLQSEAPARLASPQSPCRPRHRLEARQDRRRG